MSFMKDAFFSLYERQAKWQKDLYQRLERDQDNELVAQDIVDENLYNAIEEIIEARVEIPSRKYWNPKKAKRVMTTAEKYKCAEEIIDVIHFLFTSLIYLGLNYGDVQRIIRTKMDFNNKREDHKA